MAIFLESEHVDAEAWVRGLREFLPEVEVYTAPRAAEAEAEAEIEFALIWKPPPNVLRRCPNLKLIFCLDAGVDYILADESLPGEVPILRIVDPRINAEVSEYVVYAVLHFHRHMHYYQRCQRAGRWAAIRRSKGEAAVAMLGGGHIGSETARKLSSLGFPVRIWSRTPKRVAGATSFCGRSELPSAVDGARFLVCALPLTSQTRAIIDRRCLANVARGGYVINVGRGGHVVDEDLIGAIGEGRIGGAMLDVFNEEPLPAGHPYWTLPEVVVTPHIAAEPDPRTGARQVADNIRRFREGERLLNVVDRAAGY